MKYAVEARIFNNGKIVAKMRKASTDETSFYRETRSCDIYVDVFENEQGAKEFLNEYRKA